MSFTPGAPIRRSFKEDREERRRRKESRTRVRILAAVAVLVVVGAGAYVVYAKPDLTNLTGMFHTATPRPTPKAVVSTHLFAYRPVKPVSPLLGGTPTPLPTSTPAPTPTPVPTPTPTPGPKKTPKPKTTLATRPSRPLSVAAAGNAFSLPPTPAPALTNPPTQPPATAPPATAPPSEAVYAPQIVVDARFANRVQPDYPEIAREQSASGTAQVLVTVGPKGNVISQRLEKSAGHPALDQAALAAAARSSFLPPKIDGKPATETYRIYYTFAP